MPSFMRSLLLYILLSHRHGLATHQQSPMAAGKWSYKSECMSEQQCRTILGADNWGHDCDHGERQSPIDLRSHEAHKLTSASRFLFTNYDRTSENVAVENSGKTREYQFRVSAVCVQW